MAYTCLKRTNPAYEGGTAHDLKGAALRFLHDRCTDLRFSRDMTRREADERCCLGLSIAPNLIPYDLNMDIDRLCLENAVSRFLDSGVTEDAFDLYFCYLEMFVGRYGSTRSMIELLSEYEQNGSALLMKHRDHYVHSAYVFCLGLAIFEENAPFAHSYRRFYGIKDATDAAHHFLRYWGLTSLFHDIGYPFELPFEEAEAYFDTLGMQRREKPFLAYQRMDRFTKISEKTRRRLYELYGEDFDTTDELFACALEKKLGKTYAMSRGRFETVLKDKPTQPDGFGYFMDHAYFSANLLFHELFEKDDMTPDAPAMDALTAVILHNSLYKYSVAHFKEDINIPFDRERHPLAFLLMLCDEIQCWDRTAYGRNSRSDLYPMACRFGFENGGIQLHYVYDEKEKYKIDRYIEKIAAWKARKPARDENEELTDVRIKHWKREKPKVKECGSMIVTDERSDKCDFLLEIERIVDLTDIPVTLTIGWEKADNGRKRTYISRSSFIHLYNFATALNGRWLNHDEWKGMRKKGVEDEWIRNNEKKFEQEFEALSLEYKLSNIAQAKAFGYYLDRIGCFYTDRPVSYEQVESFTKKQIRTIGPLEHERWVRERLSMGWVYGQPVNKQVRENERCHQDMMDVTKPEELTSEACRKHFLTLKGSTQDKDTEAMNLMLKIIRLYDGLRIYKKDE